MRRPEWWWSTRCHAAWGWKGRYSCRRFRWHLGSHIDYEGTRFS